MAEEEEALDPALPIIDAHHHIWFGPRRRTTYEPEEIFADKARSGHNIVATVFVEAGEAYRADGPDHLKPVGETEMANRIGEEAAARGGAYAGVCAAISASADLRAGAHVADILDAHAAAAPARLRGIRCQGASDPDFRESVPADMFAQADFRAGFAALRPRDLVFEAWVLHPQLPHVIALARAFADTQIVLNHVGGPLATGRYKGRRAEAFLEWRALLKQAAACANIVVKLGGVTMMTSAAMPEGPQQLLSSEAIAGLQRDHLLTAIDLFGPSRALFESNYPVDRWWTNYPRLWNAFKRVTADFSAADKAALFHDTAKRVYRIG
jgi:predicted TIM-barrel fold metal-dependent hydrolase